MSIFLSSPVLLLIALLVAYLVLGNLWHRVLSPFPAPDPSTFPVVGDRFESVRERVVQEIVDIRDGWVVLRATLAPHAGGPPLHTHKGFHENVMPVEGVLHVELADRKVVTLQPGESLHIPAGMVHRPFNPTDTPVVLGGDEPAMPLSFAASLVQLYRVIDERGGSPLAMMLQMSVIDKIADTEFAGPPRWAQQMLGFVLAPAARLLGYRNYYNEYALHAPAPRPPHATAQLRNA
jgi:hypothetical protein